MTTRSFVHDPEHGNPKIRRLTAGTLEGRQQVHIIEQKQKQKDVKPIYNAILTDNNETTYMIPPNCETIRTSAEHITFTGFGKENTPVLGHAKAGAFVLSKKHIRTLSKPLKKYAVKLFSVLEYLANTTPGKIIHSLQSSKAKHADVPLILHKGEYVLPPKMTYWIEYLLRLIERDPNAYVSYILDIESQRLLQERNRIRQQRTRYSSRQSDLPFL